MTENMRAHHTKAPEKGIVSIIPSKPAPKRRKRAVPDYLVKETIDGVPFYYKGYKQVMNKTKQFEEIIAESSLQFYLKNIFVQYLNILLGWEKYFVGAGELGNHIDMNNNPSLDLVIYDREVFEARLTTKYASVTPIIVIEVDVNVEVENSFGTDYDLIVFPKVKNLLNSGVQKVIWVFTLSKTILIAEKNEDIRIVPLDRDIEILDGKLFNFAKILEQRGINLDQIS